ncbi:MAG: bacillithiol biosynthesis cysteine-adding enzyme BshC [Gemmatimonadota bacterium]|nr:bacillithiol biosynthesis cysteine-adding enzyme BshC [Gemmatimonadota bacterium]
MQKSTIVENVPDLEISVRRPDGADLVRDYVGGEGAAAAFLGTGFERLSTFEEKAEEVAKRFDRDARARAAEAMTSPEGADPERLNRFVEEGGFVVTTGQQPGLFGGPLYGVHKALTTVRLAETLEARLGCPVLPVFWIASDDHDWAEANHVDIVGTDNELHRIELEDPDPSVSPPLHRIQLGASVRERLDAFVDRLPDTEFTPELVELLRGHFTPESTMPEAYGDTLRDLLGRFGLYLTDAAHPVVKRASGPLLLDELERAGELETILSDTADGLQEAGYALQVPILEHGVNLFIEGPAGRERLYRDDGAYRMRTSGTSITADEIRTRFEQDPKVLSPNVLLRPVVESHVFPTLAYVGGPGEMAYLGQLGAYFEAHGIRMPVVFPRWSATTVETKVRKVLDKFDLDIEQLRRPFHDLVGDIAREEMPEDVRAALGKLRGEIARGVSDLQDATRPLDPTLKGPVQHVRSQSFAALDDVERKITQAVKRESEITLTQLEKARVHLYPHGQPAERVHNPFYYLARYGPGYLDALHDRFGVELS